jgi:hypothetical protein
MNLDFGGASVGKPRSFGFESGFDESECDQFYLNQCITSGRTVMKEKQRQEPMVESEKLEKIIAPFKALDLQSDDEVLGITTRSLGNDEFTHRPMAPVRESSARFAHTTLLLTKPKSKLMADDSESVLALSDFTAKYNDNAVQLPRSRYKIDGQESELVDMEEAALPTSAHTNNRHQMPRRLSSSVEAKRLASVQPSPSIDPTSKKTRIKKLFSNIFKINSN